MEDIEFNFHQIVEEFECEINIVSCYLNDRYCHMVELSKLPFLTQNGHKLLINDNKEYFKFNKILEHISVSLDNKVDKIELLTASGYDTKIILTIN